MAKRYRKKARSSFKASKFYRKKSSGISGMIPTLLGAMAYGAIRSKVAARLPQLSMLGNLGDEVILGSSAFILDKFLGNKMPILKPLFKGAVVIESARIGESIATGTTGIGQSSNSMSNSSSMLG